MKINPLTHSRRITLILLVNVLFFCLSSWLLPVMFEDNDDATMAWIASGIYSGTPDCHLVFINAIYGWLLTLLYRIIPNLEWYSISFAVLHVLSMTVIVDYWIRKTKDKWVTAGVLLLFYSFWALIIVRFQFTTTAAMAAFAATLLLLQRKFGFGGVLLLLASMVRFSAAGLVGLLMMPALINEYRIDVKKSYLPFLGIMVILLVAHCADDLFYQTPEWQYYKVFNSYRGKINDNPNLWRAVGHLPSDITEHQFRSVASFAIDPQETSASDLKKIYDCFNNTPLYKKAKNIYPNVIKRYGIWFLGVTLLFAAAIVICGRRRTWLSYLLLFFFWIGVLSFISLNGSVKFRVFLSSLLPIMFYACSALSCMRSTNHMVMKTIALISVLLFSGELINNTVHQYIKVRASQAKMAEQMSLVERSADYTIISAGADFSVECFPPFDLSKMITPRKFINPYCMMASPLNEGFSSFKDLLNGNLVYLADKHRDFSNYTEGLKVNYDIAADTIHLFETENYALIQIASTE